VEISDGRAGSAKNGARYAEGRIDIENKEGEIQEANINHKVR
jgi:hypothetical protein